MGGLTRKTGGGVATGRKGGGGKLPSSQGKAVSRVKTGSGKIIKSGGSYTAKIGGKSQTFKGIKIRKVGGKTLVFLSPGGRGTDPRNL